MNGAAGKNLGAGPQRANYPRMERSPPTSSACCTMCSASRTQQKWQIQFKTKKLLPLYSLPNRERPCVGDLAGNFWFAFDW